jgi:putative DNA primase/helicase
MDPPIPPPIPQASFLPPIPPVPIQQLPPIVPPPLDPPMSESPEPDPEPAPEPKKSDKTVSELIEAAEVHLLPPGSFMNTDSGNAKRFIHLYSDVVRFAQDSKMWYVWEGSHWRPDIGGLTVLALTAGVYQYMRLRESGIEGVDAVQMANWANRTEAESARRKMLNLVPAELKIKVLERDLDADPWKLVVQNGTLDLRTGHLGPSRPEDLCTRRAAVWHDPNATCPTWLDHVRLVTDNNAELMTYLQRACGYALTGLVDEQKFWFLWGAGQNGKNVFAEALQGLLGDYGAVAPPGLLTGGSGQHPTILADLRGARMVLADETGHEKINDTRLKMLTGSAQVKARFMGKDFFTYDSSMKLWVLGNAKPTIKDQSEGTWRRMQLVPFTVRIADDKKQLNFADRLKEEWSGILNWCLDGLSSWLTAGSVGTPAVVSDAVDKYRQEEDELGQWLEDCCSECDPTDPEGYSTNAQLYFSYTMWCTAMGIKQHEVLKQVMFGRELTGKTFGTGKIAESTPLMVGGKKMRVRYGLRVTTSPSSMFS